MRQQLARALGRVAEADQALKGLMRLGRRPVAQLRVDDLQNGGGELWVGRRRQMLRQGHAMPLWPALAGHCVSYSCASGALLSLRRRRRTRSHGRRARWASASPTGRGLYSATTNALVSSAI